MERVRGDRQTSVTRKRLSAWVRLHKSGCISSLYANEWLWCSATTAAAAATDAVGASHFPVLVSRSHCVVLLASGE